MFGEIIRVLKPDGTYLCTTLAQEHILKKFLIFFILKGYAIRLDVVRLSSDDTDLVPFLISVQRRDPKLRGVSLADGQDTTKFAKWQDAMSAVRSIQLSSSELRKLRRIGNGIVARLDLHSSDASSSTPRFHLVVVDRKGEKNQGKVAVFIVPMGSEHTWMYSSDEGLLQLAESAQRQRLIVVTLGRG